MFMEKVRAVAIALSIFLIAGCRQSRDNEEIVETFVEEEAGVVVTPDYHSCDTVSMGNRVYTYDIFLHVCDTLPTIEDDFGKVMDNTVRLLLTRNGKTYFDRTFTKWTFQSSIDATFFKNSILDGVRFVGAEAGKGLTFTLAVSEPFSDMSVPFSLTVDDYGNFSFLKDDVMDVEQSDE